MENHLKIKIKTSHGKKRDIYPLDPSGYVKIAMEKNIEIVDLPMKPPFTGWIF